MKLFYFLFFLFLHIFIVLLILVLSGRSCTREVENIDIGTYRLCENNGKCEREIHAYCTDMYNNSKKDFRAYGFQTIEECEKDPRVVPPKCTPNNLEAFCTNMSYLASYGAQTAKRQCQAETYKSHEPITRDIFQCSVKAEKPEDYIKCFSAKPTVPTKYAC